ELAGAAAPGAVSRAVDALIGVIWAAVREELRGADADLVAELTERLALIGELVRSAALERWGAEPVPPAGEPGPPAREPVAPTPEPASGVPAPSEPPPMAPPPPVATTRAPSA